MVNLPVPDLPAELVAQPPAIADELDEAILTGSLADDESPVRRWAIRSLDEAEWAMRKLAALDGRAGEIADQSSVWYQRIREWETRERARIEPGVRFFTERLQRYALDRRALDERHNKTTFLPSGSIATRGSADPKVVVDDEAVVIAWAKSTLDDSQREDVVKVEESVRVSELRKVVKVGERDVLLAAETWEKVTGIIIDDPGGWQHNDAPAWNAPISLTEFQLRASLSTVRQEEPTEPSPSPQYVVVDTASGEVVPGVSIEWAETTATVKLADPRTP